MNVDLMKLLVDRGTLCPKSTSTTSDTILHMIARNWHKTACDDGTTMVDILTQLVISVTCYVVALVNLDY